MYEVKFDTSIPQYLQEENYTVPHIAVDKLLKLRIRQLNKLNESNKDNNSQHKQT